MLRAIRAGLPAEHLIYVGDSGCAPYGDRSAAFVTERATILTQFLVGQGAKAVVVACNTATFGRCQIAPFAICRPHRRD